MRKLAIVCGVLCAMATLHAAQYATEVKNLYVDSKDLKVVGKLLPTTEVQVIKKENARVLLAVQGYADANLNLAVYFVPGKRILSVGLTKFWHCAKKNNLLCKLMARHIIKSKLRHGVKMML